MRRVNPDLAEADAGDEASPASPMTASALPPLLVRAKAAAALCGLSEATWHRLSSAGKTPKPLRLGGAVLWRTAELSAWTLRGCPSRAEWSAIWAASQQSTLLTRA